ncbi:MAG: hypothetical protein AB9903_22930 [Vulcanimicrobiota bacterium]
MKQKVYIHQLFFNRENVKKLTGLTDEQLSKIGDKEKNHNLSRQKLP